MTISHNLMNALYIKWINAFLSAFFVLGFLCDAFSCVILLKIGIPIELEGESSMISVCMATYNGEKYLKDQLDSILKQMTFVLNNIFPDKEA